MTEAKTRGDTTAVDSTAPNGKVGARRIIRSKEVVKRVGFGRVTLWRKASDPNDDFPAPVQLIGNLIGWFENEIDAWLESRPRVNWAAAKENVADKGPGPDADKGDPPACFDAEVGGPL